MRKDILLLFGIINLCSWGRFVHFTFLGKDLKYRSDMGDMGSNTFVFVFESI